MSLKIKINRIRKKITQGLTGGLGKTSKINIGTIDPMQVKRVLISRPNHRLGNLLLITPLVQEVQQLFPNSTIDVFIKGNLGPIVFENYSQINQIIRLPKKHFNELGKYMKGWVKLKTNKYDLVINADKSSSSGRLSIQLVNSKFKCFGDSETDLSSQYDDFIHMAKNPVYNLRHFLSIIGMEVPKSPVPNLLLNLNAQELNKGKELIDSIVPSSKKTICLFTFATGAKCYSKEWWAVFYDRMLKEFPEYNILEVLPVENVSQIDFVAPTYYSKDIREIVAFLKNTTIFIGADSGMMHLASAAHIPVIGLFSVTDTNKYAPFNEKSVAINTNETNIEDWIKAIKDRL